MIILVDTREQKPVFRHELSDGLVRRVCLPCGDYCAEFDGEMKSTTVFERKSIADLYGTLGKGYARFKKEMMRAKQSKLKLVIIVEGSLLDVLKGIRHSQRDSDSLMSQVFTIRMRHGVETVFCSSRVEMAEYIMRFYWAQYKDYLYRSGKEKEG